MTILTSITLLSFGLGIGFAIALRKDFEKIERSTPKQIPVSTSTANARELGGGKAAQVIGRMTVPLKGAAIEHWSVAN